MDCHRREVIISALRQGFEGLGHENCQHRLSTLERDRRCASLMRRTPDKAGKFARTPPPQFFRGYFASASSVSLIRKSIKQTPCYETPLLPPSLYLTALAAALLTAKKRSLLFSNELETGRTDRSRAVVPRSQQPMRRSTLVDDPCPSPLPCPCPLISSMLK